VPQFRPPAEAGASIYNFCRGLYLHLDLLHRLVPPFRPSAEAYMPPCRPPAWAGAFIWASILDVSTTEDPYNISTTKIKYTKDQAQPSIGTVPKAAHNKYPASKSVRHQKLSGVRMCPLSSICQNINSSAFYSC